MTVAVPFTYLAHLLTVPVLVGEIETTFVLDTGIGVNLISASLARRAGCAPAGPVLTGRRMSGQELTVPLGPPPPVRLGGRRGEDVPIGILDMGAMAGLDGIEGFLSLSYFRSAPVTADYPAGVVALEDGDSLARRAEAGVAVGVQVERDGCSTDVFPGLELAIRQAGPEVMFQKIIYEGLTGHAFLRNFVVTYDLPATRMIFAPASAPPAR